MLYLKLFIISFYCLLSNNILASDTLLSVEEKYTYSMNKYNAQNFDSEVQSKIVYTAPVERKDRTLYSLESNIKLFHAFNAAIDLLSNYKKIVKKDFDHSWTYKNSGIFSTEGEKFSYNSIIDIKDVEYNTKQIYELERQKIYFDFTALWDLVVFWKKNIFLYNTDESYSHLNAISLRDQIQSILEKRSEFLQNPYYISSLKDSEKIDCWFSIVDLLRNITDALPERLRSNVTVDKNYSVPKSKLKNKIKRNLNLYSEKIKVYGKFYTDFDKLYYGVYNKILELQSDPSNINKILPELKRNYKEFQNFRFPVQGKEIIFSCSALDFQKIEFSPILKLTDNLEKSLEDILHHKEEYSFLNFQDSNLEKIFSNILNVLQDKEDLSSADDVDDKKEDKKQNIIQKEISPLKLKEEPIDQIELSQEENVLYDKEYWRQEQEFHQQRKRLLINQMKQQSSSNTSDYYSKLQEFLETYIYKYQKISVRKFKKNLKEYKFKVTVNSSGKGSLHYISATYDNPLFADHPYYSGAYFNVHLPHLDKEIIPHDYFEYMRSGFSNVFGLTRSS